MMAWIVFGIFLGLGLGSWIFYTRSESQVRELETEHRARLMLVSQEGEKRVDRIQRDSLRQQSDVEHRFLVELLPTLDALDNAMRVDETADPQTLLDGVHLIRDAFVLVLGNRGIELVEPQPGTPFEPREHEAAALDEFTRSGVISECLRIGYRKGEHVLRPAMVVVGSLKVEAQESVIEEE